MSLPAFLVPERELTENGHSEAVELTGSTSPVLVSLGVLHVLEQQSLLLTIKGSTDGENWRDLNGFPEKFYPGISAIYVDPAECTSIRADWKVNRWGRGDKNPKFRVYVFAEPV